MGSYISLDDIAAGLNQISWKILKLLKSDSLSYSELKKHLDCSQEKVSKEIARLEGACLVFSKRNTMDQRIVDYSITQHGLDISAMSNNTKEG